MEQITNLLSDTAVRRIVKKNTVLLRQGDTPNQVFFVAKGCVKLYRTGSTGEEQVVAFRVAGDMFPEPCAFGHTATTIYNYETVEQTELIMVDQDTFTTLLAKNPELHTACFHYLMKNYMAAMLQVTALGQSYATDKLAMVLYYLMLKYGKQKKPGEYWVKVKLSHATLASLTGLARETVTTELGVLRRKGIIEYESGKLMVRRPALTDRLGDSGFTETLL